MQWRWEDKGEARSPVTVGAAAECDLCFVTKGVSEITIPMIEPPWDWKRLEANKT
jgi:hypothetical protein